VKGEHRGEQGAEAVEPGGQEAQAKKEGFREAASRQGAGGKALNTRDGVGRVGLPIKAEFAADAGSGKHQRCERRQSVV